MSKTLNLRVTRIFLVFSFAISIETKSAPDISCLTQEQLASFSNALSGFRSSMNLERRYKDLQALQAKRDAQREGAYDCGNRLSNAISSIGALLEGCKSIVEEYNSTINRINDAQRTIKEDQETYLNQVQLQRSFYPYCK